MKECSKPPFPRKKSPVRQNVGRGETLSVRKGMQVVGRNRKELKRSQSREA